MKDKMKTVCFDEDLHIEAFHLQNITQPFPNHFHDYYVIGFVKSGIRQLNCKNKDYLISQGHIVIFNPLDNHSCSQNDNNSFDYCGFNISKETMLLFVEEITGQKILPEFNENVIMDKELYQELLSLHQMIVEYSSKLKKEEMMVFFMTHLLEKYGYSSLKQPFIDRKEIYLVCQLIEEHFNEPISLKQLCHYSHLSQSTLLRAFTKYIGVTPYRYLQNIRINKAKKLLEQGLSPIEVSFQTGFSDQSHFSHFFNMFTGLSPAAYKRIFKDEKDDKQ